ncbi:MAG TPA: zinc-ribbon domain-containing protein [Candidatus Acidoferrales bacterium]|nr:zinc-ribbon domain-containing protein [Candidatus Acidoferrales bacterium]
MPMLCLHCSAQMPDTAAFCPGCGRPTQAGVRARQKAGFLPENIAGALAYLTFIPAIVFLVRQPYNRNRFVRFHSIQCLLLWAFVLVAIAVLKITGVILFNVPVAGPLFVVLLSVAAVIGACLIWLVLVIKAAQGQMFKLPLIGPLAEHYAAAQ